VGAGALRLIDDPVQLSEVLVKMVPFDAARCLPREPHRPVG
jgi:hypothetical protein